MKRMMILSLTLETSMKTTKSNGVRVAEINFVGNLRRKDSDGLPHTFVCILCKVMKCPTLFHFIWDIFCPLPCHLCPSAARRASLCTPQEIVASSTPLGQAALDAILEAEGTGELYDIVRAVSATLKERATGEFFEPIVEAISKIIHQSDPLFLKEERLATIQPLNRLFSDPGFRKRSVQVGKSRAE